MPIPDDADKEKLAEIALAILWVGAYKDQHETRVWKGMDWDLTDLLFEKGWISDPKSKAKSVQLTEEGEKLSQEFFEKYFSNSK
jgi:predicted transcriptional regulator